MVLSSNKKVNKVKKNEKENKMEMKITVNQNKTKI